MHFAHRPTDPPPPYLLDREVTVSIHAAFAQRRTCIPARIRNPTAMIIACRCGEHGIFACLRRSMRSLIRIVRMKCQMTMIDLLFIAWGDKTVPLYFSGLKPVRLYHSGGKLRGSPRDRGLIFRRGHLTKINQIKGRQARRDGVRKQKACFRLHLRIQEQDPPGNTRYGPDIQHMKNLVRLN